MPAFRTMLVATDFSEQSKEAFRIACSLAEETKTRVFVLHVAEQTVTGGGLPLLLPPVLVDSTYHVRLRELMEQDFVPPVPLDVQYRVCDGEPMTEILREASDLGADLIVMGTHGRSGLRRLLTGSVAEDVLRHARCPVLAISVPESPHKGPETRSILLTTDFSECSVAATRVARTIARDRGARLNVIHIEPEFLFAGDGIVLPLDPIPWRESLDALRKTLDGPDLKHPVQADLIVGAAPTQIFETAEDRKCDLIVMGTHGRKGIGRLLMGSVAEAVLRESRCPVLMVKAAEPESARPAHTEDTPAQASS